MNTALILSTDVQRDVLDTDYATSTSSDMCDSSLEVLQSTIDQLTRLEESKHTDYIRYLVNKYPIDLERIEKIFSDYKEELREEQEYYFDDAEEIFDDYKKLVAQDEYFTHADKTIAEYKSIRARYLDENYTLNPNSCDNASHVYGVHSVNFG